MRITLESVRLRLLLMPLAAAALTIGCGDGHALDSTVGPSADAPALLAADTGGAATASTSRDFEALAKGGRGGGSGKDKDKAKHTDTENETDTDDDDDDDEDAGKPDGDRGHKPDHGNGGPGRSHEDRVVGFVSAKTSDSLTVKGITVVVGKDAVIRHGHRSLTIGDIEVGNHIQARGEMDGTKLVATEIKVEGTRHDTDEDEADEDEDEDEAEAKGTVFEFSGASGCPAVTFKVGETAGTATKVTTTSTTTFSGVTCATLANGAKVEVEGTKQTDGSITAASVKLK